LPTTAARLDEAAPAARATRAGVVKRWVFGRAHAAYLALPPGLRGMIRRHRPLFMRDYVRWRMMPVLHEARYGAAPAWREAAPALQSAARAAPAAPPAPARGGSGGLSIAGYFDYTTGMAQMAHGMLRAAQAGGMDCDIYRLPVPGRHVQLASALGAAEGGTVPREVLLMCMNADSMELLPEILKRAAAPGSYRIGTWYWELEGFPSVWQAAFEEVDELWAGSPFVQAALARVSPRPVVLMPPQVDFTLTRAYRRAEFGLPEGCFLFLFSYDFDSFVERKNPAACIAAFQRAFAPGDAGVGLVIKSQHGERHPRALAQLRELARSDSRVRLVEESLTRADTYGLLSVCDCYVSLHRSEGFGYGMAEAMRLGKPVIATGYSGNLAFMRADNSCLVNYSLVPVAPDAYPHAQGQMWAEPDVDDAAAWMVKVARDAAFREQLGARAAAHMATHFSAQAVGARMRERLALVAHWRAQAGQRPQPYQ
jgi:glycosyltransferase involved in cell wall biosynthesis